MSKLVAILLAGIAAEKIEKRLKSENAYNLRTKKFHLE